MSTLSIHKTEISTLSKTRQFLLCQTAKKMQRGAAIQAFLRVLANKGIMPRKKSLPNREENPIDPINGN